MAKPHADAPLDLQAFQALQPNLHLRQKQNRRRTDYGSAILALAVTKGLLQSGVSYVGGYQGSPISHLIDVMVQAAPEIADLGVYVEPCTNEASAAAMLGASIMYPVRGAVKWKSIVGANVVADALSILRRRACWGAP